MKFLILLSLLSLAPVAFADTITENACDITAHEGDVCDWEVKNLQSLAAGGTVISCTKIQTPAETKYVVVIPKSVQGPVTYDIKVNNTGDNCNITSMTIRP